MDYLKTKGRKLAKQSKDIVKKCQNFAAQLLEEGLIKNPEVLSLDLISNGLSALTDMGGFFKDKR